MLYLVFAPKGQRYRSPGQRPGWGKRPGQPGRPTQGVALGDHKAPRWGFKRNVPTQSVGTRKVFRFDDPLLLRKQLRHRQGLHNKQLLLQQLVNDSLWLFPMAATLWFASQPEMRTKSGIRELATYFCQEMADRLYPPSSPARRISRHKKDAIVYRLSTTIMSGEYAWLEEGIAPLLEK